MNYPITYWVESIGDELFLSCSECGVHHGFGDSVELSTMMIEAQAHQDTHLFESLRQRDPAIAPPPHP